MDRVQGISPNSAADLGKGTLRDGDLVSNRGRDDGDQNDEDDGENGETDDPNAAAALLPVHLGASGANTAAVALPTLLAPAIIRPLEMGRAPRVGPARANPSLAFEKGTTTVALALVTGQRLEWTDAVQGHAARGAAKVRYSALLTRALDSVAQHGLGHTTVGT